MCFTLSLDDEERRSTEINNNTTDRQSDAMVRNIFLLLSPSDWIGKKEELTHLVVPTQDVTVDDKDDPNFDPTAPVLEDESHQQIGP